MDHKQTNKATKKMLSQQFSRHIRHRDWVLYDDTQSVIHNSFCEDSEF